MKLLDQNPKEYFDKIIDTEPKNRPWVLSVVINFILFFGLCLMYYLYNEAKDERIRAESKLEIQVQANLKDNKDYSRAIREAEKARDDYWEIKFNNQKNITDNLISKEATKMEAEIKRLTQQTNSLIRRTNNKINNQ